MPECWLLGSFHGGSDVTSRVVISELSKILLLGLPKHVLHGYSRFLQQQLQSVNLCTSNKKCKVMSSPVTSDSPSHQEDCGVKIHYQHPPHDPVSEVINSCLQSEAYCIPQYSWLSLNEVKVGYMKLNPLNCKNWYDKS